MGTFRHKVKISNPKTPRRSLETEALVDTGAFFSSLPAERLEGLGLAPTEQEDFLIADGRVIRRGICEARIKIDGRERTTIVVFGDTHSPVLLGAYTLEAFGLAVDPRRRRLVPLPTLPLL